MSGFTPTMLEVIPRYYIERHCGIFSYSIICLGYFYLHLTNLTLMSVHSLYSAIFLGLCHRESLLTQKQANITVTIQTFICQERCCWIRKIVQTARRVIISNLSMLLLIIRSNYWQRLVRQWYPETYLINISNGRYRYVWLKVSHWF